MSKQRIEFEFEDNRITYDFTDIEGDNLMKAVAVILVNMMFQTGYTVAELVEILKKDFLPQTFVEMLFTEGKGDK